MTVDNHPFSVHDSREEERKKETVRLRLHQLGELVEEQRRTLSKQPK